ncbi:MAG: hypothetical protein JWO96_759 [Candidatus Saccharibacteria bacterium]|nr:hypothetical protein [Candidatus Saccharibacteria bacterium]
MSVIERSNFSSPSEEAPAPETSEEPSSSELPPLSEAELRRLLGLRPEVDSLTVKMRERDGGEEFFADLNPVREKGSAPRIVPTRNGITLEPSYMYRGGAVSEYLQEEKGNESFWVPVEPEDFITAVVTKRGARIAIFAAKSKSPTE